MKIIPNLDEQRLERAHQHVQTIKGFYKHLTAYILVNIFIVLTVYFNTNHKFFSFETFATPIFWGIGLFLHGLKVFGNNVILGADWEDRKIKKYMENDERTKWE